jgi:RNA polymerase primary sigma factor
MLGELPEPARAVLECRYGLDGAEPRTTREIGRELHITADRVMRIEREALALLASNQMAQALGEAA